MPLRTDPSVRPWLFADMAESDSEAPESLEGPDPEMTEEDDSSGTGYPGPDPDGVD